MTFLGLLAHLAGFVAPALVVALLLALVPRLRQAGRQGKRRWTQDLAWLWLAGVLVLLAGLAYFGRDGKMATYAALVVVQGTLGWWLQRR
jgi:multisubunit Na+/H+ antiporter MnhB subunit